MNRGKAFEREFKSSMDNAGLYSMRIPDKIYWTGKRIASEETPADFFGISATGNPFMVECKATAQKSLSFSALQEHQHRALTDFQSYHANCRSFIAVNFYSSESIRERNLCFIIPLAVWDEYLAGDRKSIGMKQCEGDARIIKCPRAKGSTFDLSYFVSIFS